MLAGPDPAAALEIRGGNHFIYVLFYCILADFEDVRRRRRRPGGPVKVEKYCRAINYAPGKVGSNLSIRQKNKINSSNNREQRKKNIGSKFGTNVRNFPQAAQKPHPKSTRTKVHTNLSLQIGKTAPFYPLTGQSYGSRKNAGIKSLVWK